MAVNPYPPYSPDFAPCDFFLFPKMKLKQKERRSDTIEETHPESQRLLDTLDRKGLPGSVTKMEGRWDRCLYAGGNYFEGDGGR
jgi:hypothetical protein